MIIIDLIYNLSVLVALSVLSGFIDSRYDRNTSLGKILQGILFGIVAIIGMHYPFILEKGIIFDGRSIVISLCTLFFGPISGLISSILAVIFRIYLGGGGILTGSLVITASFLIGYLFHINKIKRKFNSTKVGLYSFGFLVSAVMMGLMLTLPTNFVGEAYRTITATVMIFYPLITMLIGKVLLDQEENKNYLDRITQEKNLYLTTLYSIGDGVITTDMNGAVKQMNHVAEQLTGWSESEAKGKPLEEIFKIIDEDNRNIVANPVQRVLNEGQVIGLTNHALLVSKDGKEIPIANSGAPIKDVKGNIIGVVLVFRDQTGERAKQKAILKSEEEFRNFFENSPLGKSITGIDGSVKVNKSFCEMLGYSKDELSNKKWEELTHRDDNQKSKDVATSLLNGEEASARFEKRYIHKNGNEVWTEVNITLQRDAQGNPKFFITTVNNITERKRAEIALRESIERLHIVLNSAPITIFSTDSQGVFTLHEGKALKKLGMKPGHNVGKSAFDLFATLPVAESSGVTTNGKTVLRRVLAGETVFGVTELNGVYFDNQFAPLQDIDGKVIGLVGVATDITEHKLAEEALKESYEFNKSLLQTIPFGMNIVDQDGNILFMNQNLKLKFGKDVIGKKCWSFYKDDKTQCLDCPLKSRIEIGETLTTETDKVLNGRTFQITHTGMWFEGKKAILEIFQDITERKRAEDQIEVLSRAVEQSAVTIVITNQDGDIEYVNPKFSEITGYLFEEAVGKNSRFLQSGEKSKEEYVKLWDTILAGEKWRGVFHNKKKNGELYWEDAVIFPIVSKSGAITHFVAIKEDITEKKNILEDLVLAKEKAEKSDKLKTEFLAQMSHEIRSPMNVALSFTELIKEEFKDVLSPQLADYIAGIEDAGKRLIRTVELILNASEMQVGTYQPTWTTVDLMSDILNHIKRDYSNAANKKGLQLTLRSRISHPIIFCDKYSVNQIFINLVDNAIKYTKEGAVNILADKNEENKIKVIVEDTGIGMSEEFMAVMYDIFMQEERGYSRRYEGNGLGLSLIKKYCDLNKATITVESEKKKGTKFIVTFPNNEE